MPNVKSQKSTAKKKTNKKEDKQSGIITEALELLEVAGLKDRVKETKEVVEDYDGNKVPAVYVLFDTEDLEDSKIFESKDLQVVGYFLALWVSDRSFDRFPKAKKTTIVHAKTFTDDEGNIKEAALEFIQIPASYA